VKHLARDIIGLIEATFPKSIEVHHEIAPDLWPVRGNATQIHQLFLNFCVNARDAMPCGGTLRITAANRQLDSIQEGASAGAHPGLWVILEFADSGTGIPPEILEHIWEPFFTTKRASTGSGLGLSTVRGIVARHAGFIEVDTAVGRGTTFRVFLPAIKSKSTQLSPERSPVISRGNGELILVADDDKAVRNMVSALLGKHGYRVVSCVDGLEAIAMFNAQPDAVSLVVTDIDMPRFGGVALARAVLKERPNIRIIAISGTDARDAAMIKPFSHAFFIKPFKQTEFLCTVHRLLHPTENPPAERG